MVNTYNSMIVKLLHKSFVEFFATLVEKRFANWIYFYNLQRIK